MKEGNEEARGQEKPLDLTFNSSGFTLVTLGDLGPQFPPW